VTDVPVPRASAIERALALVTLAIAASHAVVPLGMGRWHVVATVLAVVTAVLARRASAPLRGLTEFLACFSASSHLPLPWQATMAISLAGYALVTRLLGEPWPSRALLQRGTVPIGWTCVVAGVTPVALVTWVMVLRPDLHDVVDRYLPNLPLPALLAGAFGFALVNAVLEELIWRGVIQDRLDPLFGPAMAIALQALSFGLQHAHGIPRGVVGVVLAGSWAVMLGMLRRHTRGLLAPFLAHVVADTVVASIVLFYAR
jgi:membrane protease YdiL (CAAX protease family)